MNIGITGAKGFLGAHILRRLKSNPAVKSIDIFDVPESDILDKAAVEKFVKGKDAIIHLAALNRAEDMELMKVNLLGTMNLVNAIISTNAECRLVFASSFQVYSKSCDNDVIDEIFGTEPLSIYGFSKLFGEEIIRYRLTNYSILRISNIYGPGCKPFYNSVVATFTHLAKEGKDIVINGSGKQARDFVFVEDVAAAFELAALSKKTGVFNICSGEAISLNDLASLLKKSFPKVNIVRKPAAEDNLYTRGVCKKARSAFAWSPVFSFEQGLVKCL